jgi:hypothetical protein
MKILSISHISSTIFVKLAFPLYGLYKIYKVCFTSCCYHIMVQLVFIHSKAFPTGFIGIYSISRVRLARAHIPVKSPRPWSWAQPTINKNGKTKIKRRNPWFVYPTLPGFPQFDENHESTH